MKARLVLSAVLASGCGRIGFDALGDAHADATRDTCHFGSWSAPTLVTELSTDDEEYSPGISADGNTVVFESDRPGTLGNTDVWIASRASSTSPFDPPVNVSAVNSSAIDGQPSLSADGLTLLFRSTRMNAGSLYISQRASTAAAFGPPTDLAGSFGQFSLVSGPRMTPDELTLYFHAIGGGGPGGRDLWMAARSNRTDPWNPPVLLDVSGPADDSEPALDPDQLTLYFLSNRLEVPNDQFVATRTDLQSPFSAPMVLQDVQLGPGVGEYGLDVSDDGRTMVLSIDRGTPLKSNIWISTRSCQ